MIVNLETYSIEFRLQTIQVGTSNEETKLIGTLCSVNFYVISENSYEI